MKENTCNYSDNWQSYIGDYDKYEYDIKCHNGTIYENCYPNAGNFNPYTNQKLSIEENQVSEIRFSNNPKMMLNESVSQFKTVFEKLADNSEITFTQYNRDYSEYLNSSDFQHLQILPFKRDLPKIGRNTLCTCQSGKKYKNCCLK